MVVCACRGVRDEEIERFRFRGVTCVDQLAAECGAGADCGMCRDAVRKLLSTSGANSTPPSIARSAEDFPRVVAP
jgi:bacterioferritin-associated ferredoxin